MAARSPHARTPRTDLDRFVEARDLAHREERWDPRATDTRPRSVFREFGRYRWLLVPLAALGFAIFVWAVAGGSRVVTSQPSQSALDAETEAGIRERAAAATPGPWRVDERDRDNTADTLDVPYDEAPELFWLRGPDFYDLDEDGSYFREADADFIAGARTDIPVLLAEIDRLRSELWTLMNNVDGALLRAMCLREDGDEEPEWADDLEAAANAARTALNAGPSPSTAEENPQ